MAETSGGAVLARMLVHEGVDRIFGIVDGTYTQLFAQCAEHAHDWSSATFNQ